MRIGKPTGRFASKKDGDQAAQQPQKQNQEDLKDFCSTFLNTNDEGEGTAVVGGGGEEIDEERRAGQQHKIAGPELKPLRADALW